MATLTLTFDLSILYLVAANVIAILVYVLLAKYRSRRTARRLHGISAAIVDYFGREDVRISAECVGRAGGRRFFAFVDSPPLKRFRYSHIVEMSLCQYVRKTCGLELERVYWRFPVVPSAQKGEMVQQLANEDEYINEGLLRLKAKTDYSVGPASWEQFEAALHDETGKTGGEA